MKGRRKTLERGGERMARERDEKWTGWVHLDPRILDAEILPSVSMDVPAGHQVVKKARSPSAM